MLPPSPPSQCSLPSHPHFSFPFFFSQIVGIHQRANDLKVNICRLKQLTNMRSAGADEKTNLTPPTLLSLEEAVEYIEDTEFVEVTPAAIRMGKAGKK